MKKPISIGITAKGEIKMKSYISAELEILRLDDDDIIMTSPTDPFSNTDPYATKENETIIVKP